MSGHDREDEGIDGVEDALALVGRGAARAHARHQDPGRGTERSRGAADREPRDQPDHRDQSDRHGRGGSRGPAAGAAPVDRRGAMPWSAARALASRVARATESGQLARARRVPLDRALGLILAEPLTALTDLPSFDTSAMDGWAVSGPGPWSVHAASAASAASAVSAESAVPGTSGTSDASGTQAAPSTQATPGKPSKGPARKTSPAGILAGQAEAEPLPDGVAVRIATGARVPADTTAVIRTEHARTDSTGHLHAVRQPTPGQDIRSRGQECRSGDRLLPTGSLVTPAVLGLAAAAGYDELLTVPRPRVEVLVLGDELLTGGLPHDGLIRDALGPMIAPWLRALGAEVLATRRLGDDAEALHRALTASEADLILTTGGTAAGPVDHVHPVLARVGAELLVDGVAVRPGHPMLLARLPSGRHLVGLPGNPLAAVSGLLTLAEPLLRALSGRARSAPYHAPLREPVPGHPHDTRLVPFVYRDEGLVPLRFHGPAMLRGIAASDGIAVVTQGGARPGDELEVLDLPWTASVDGGCFT
ncbi:molybdopterin molybdotransferase MoeA [Streptomyces corynorhini]|uniref:Molybdopterin molybdenumtransferase n=1 Tax=Streptomyces corynorhini TaxID=2282652 RepID=A0A370B3E5_9ACTN|nr:molybdopterin molybdotransferase MoeA [Streptomyces corynorhini]RDG36328.1 molybdopterin molybdenumtransferase MoeA [Streptomyces corynorhini]